VREEKLYVICARERISAERGKGNLVRESSALEASPDSRAAGGTGKTRLKRGVKSSFVPASVTGNVAASLSAWQERGGRAGSPPKIGFSVSVSRAPTEKREIRGHGPKKGPAGSTPRRLSYLGKEPPGDQACDIPGTKITRDHQKIEKLSQR